MIYRFLMYTLIMNYTYILEQNQAVIYRQQPIIRQSGLRIGYMIMQGHR